MSIKTYLESRQNNFDFLRFVFALIVACAHIIYLSDIQELKYLVPYFPASMSVCGFFIISGTLITGSLMKTGKLKAYFIKRWNRIMPAYITVVVLSAVFFSFISLEPLWQYFTNTSTLKYLISNLLLLNFICPVLPGVFAHNPYPEINGALWSIKVEVAFYLILPLLMAAIRMLPLKKQWILLMAAYICSLLYVFGINYLNKDGAHGLLFALSHQFPAYLCYFISGVAAYLYRNRLKTIPHAAFIISIGILWLESNYDMLILKPIAFTIIILYIASRFRFLNNFGKYGDFSYGIYIFHYPIIQLIIYLGWFHKSNPYIAALTALLITICAGVLSWHLIEKRFLYRRKKQVKS